MKFNAKTQSRQRRKESKFLWRTPRLCDFALKIKMLILDELKKNDPQLRLVAGMLAAGLFILLAGLWWVQVVSARKYQGHLETQSYRTVRLPAMRGKILDREGRVLAENRPRYNLSLYLDDLRKQFKAASDAEYASATNARAQFIAAQEKQLGRPLTKAERKQFTFTTNQMEQLRAQARYRVASAVVSQIGQKLGQPLTLDPAKFERDYETRLAMPYTVIPNASPEQVARFEEQDFGVPRRGRGFATRPLLSARHDGGTFARLFVARRQFQGRRGCLLQLLPAGLSRRDRDRMGLRFVVARTRRRRIRARQQSRLSPVRKYLERAGAGPQRRADD